MWRERLVDWLATEPAFVFLAQDLGSHLVASMSVGAARVAHRAATQSSSSASPTFATAMSCFLWHDLQRGK